MRIGLSQARWFGRKCDGATYAARVDHAVEMANAHGLYVILELHWTDVGGMAPCDASCGIGLQPMPDAENIELWRQVAAVTATLAWCSIFSTSPVWPTGPAGETAGARSDAAPFPV